MIKEEKETEDTNKNNRTDTEYKREEANGNLGDPSAKRNLGPDNTTQRPNQKDELANLHIGGNETTGYGANTTGANENAAGPGFEAEGSEYTNDHPVKEE